MKAANEQSFKRRIINKKNIMSLKTKAFIYQFLCFAVLFIAARFALEAFSGLSGFWLPLTAFVIGTLLAPKFRVIKTNDGEKMFVKWLFLKGVKEV